MAGRPRRREPRHGRGWPPGEVDAVARALHGSKLKRPPGTGRATGGLTAAHTQMLNEIAKLHSQAADSQGPERAEYARQAGELQAEADALRARIKAIEANSGGTIAEY